MRGTLVVKGLKPVLTVEQHNKTPRKPDLVPWPIGTAWVGRIITQTRGRAFETLGRAFSFLLNPQKLA